MIVSLGVLAGAVDIHVFRGLCDSNFPCKRCKDDGQVCTISIKRKKDSKELSRGYAEAIESTHLILIATIYKLYFMVRNNQPWELGEPDLNDYGQPVIHTIAQKLDCIRLSSDIDLPLHGVFPDHEAGMAELALQLGEQQMEEVSQEEATEVDSSVSNRTERASPSELDHSSVESDYLKAFSENATALSVQNFTGNNCDSAFDSLAFEMGDLARFPPQPSWTPNYFPWLMFTTVEAGDLALQSLQELDVAGGMNMVGKGLLEPASDICFTREFA
ncbi:hypothetical protein NM208_g1049 [Fusarium decemcellulare]|uniref:Uncharacterized protein n=1 Tax=Fusarium decemcellulare TaxID=57161 RepID=A0ACC1SXR1_9HYPO|nr:hypothetical protein NM208_g1049 [Fusarium decemcellulare]